MAYFKSGIRSIEFDAASFLFHNIFIYTASHISSIPAYCARARYNH